MTVGFLDRLDVIQIDWRKGRAVWELHTPLRYRTAVLPDVTIFTPLEFITDLATVPRLPLAFLLAGGRGNRAAVVHDFGYQFGYVLSADNERIVVDRPTMDRIFHEALLADPMSGAGSVTAWQMWSAVRVGGRGIWGDRPERTPELNPIWSTEWAFETP